MEVAMPDEKEYAKASELYCKAFHPPIVLRSERHKELLDFYNNLTGENETEPNAIMHHRIAQYGPPYEICGKPYRTLKATFCAACGHKREVY